MDSLTLPVTPWVHVTYLLGWFAAVVTVLQREKTTQTSEDKGSIPDSAIYQLCDWGNVILPWGASVSLSVKWEW